MKRPTTGGEVARAMAAGAPPDLTDARAGANALAAAVTFYQGALQRAEAVAVHHAERARVIALEVEQLRQEVAELRSAAEERDASHR